MFSRVFRLSAGFAVRTAAVAILIAALASVGSAQTLSVNPTSLSFSAAVGSTAPQTQSVSVLSSGTAMFWYAQLPGGSPTWLTNLTPYGTTGTTLLNVTINPTGVTAGTHNGTVQVWAPGSINAGTASTPLSIQVTLIVGSTGTISVSTNTLTYTATVGGASPASQTVQVSTSSSTDIVATATATSATPGWLSIAPSSGTVRSGSPLTLTISAATGSLTSNSYTGTITITSGSSTQTVSVTFNVQPGSIITASPNPVYVSAQTGTSAVTQTVTITNSTASAVLVTPGVSAGSGWLSTTGALTIPASSTGNFTLTANPGVLAATIYTGEVTFTPSGGGTAITVPVYFTVTSTPTLSLSKTSMLFNTSTSALTDSVTLTNSSTSAISYNITVTYNKGTNWLSINPVTGSVAANGGTQLVTVQALTGTLATDNYSATISVTPISGGGSTQTISVTFSVGGAVAISANPSTGLTINAATGSSATAQVTINSTSAVSVAPLAGTSVYCTTPSYQYCGSISPGSGVASPGSGVVFTVTSYSALSAGTYTGTISFNSSAGSVNVPLTINVGVGGGSLTVTPSTLSFSAAVGGAAQSSQMYISGGVGGFYTASSNVGWLSVGSLGSTSASVLVPGYLYVYANPAGLTASTYSGSITLSGAGGSQTVFATFMVGGGSGTGLTVNPATLNFTAAVGSGLTAAQSVNVYGTTATTFFASVATGGSWLQLNQSSGATGGSFAVQANASGLNAGSYYGSINVTSAIGSQTVSVTLTVGGGGSGILTAQPSSLSFYTPLGGTPATQSVQISAGGSVIGFTASASTSTGGNWLSVTPTSGNTTGTLIVSVNTSGLTAGAYNGQISVSGGSAGSLSVPVTLTVGGAPGSITASPSALQFQGDAGGPYPAAQTVTLSTGSASADYSASTGANWISVVPTSGTITPASPGTLTVRVSAGNLTAGTYNGSIVVNGGGGTIVVQITFIVGGGGGGTGTGGGLTATPASLTLSAALGSTSIVQQGVVLGSVTAQTFSAYATTTTGAGWLSVTPSSGSAPTTIYIQANPTGLTTGVYNGNIQILTALGSLAIPVTFNVGVSGAGGLTVSPNPLTFSGQSGGAAPAAQSLYVSSSTGISTTFTASVSNASWLTVSPSSGYTPATLTVLVNPSGMAAGTYTGYINVLGSDGFTQQSVQVTLTLSSANLSVTPASLTFTAATGASAPTQTLAVSSPLGAVTYSASATTASGGAWLSVSPTSGVTSGTLTVTASAAGMNAGSYSGTITVSSGVGSVSVPVTFTVTQVVNMTVAPETLTFEALAGATSTPTKTVTVNVSTGNLQYTTTVATTSGGNWLQATPTSGATPGTLTVTANPTGLNPGVYTGTVTVAVTGATNTPRTVAVTLTITSPAPVVTAVLNAAAGNAGILAAGTIASIYGRGVGPDTAAFPQIVAGGLVPTQVGDVKVYFDGVAAPILYAQARQVNVVIPWSLFGRTTVRVEVEYKGNRSTATPIPLYDAAPAIFTLDGSGTGPGAVLNQDGSVNSSSNGASVDSVVAIYATGMGQTDPLGVDGAIPFSVLPKPLLPATVLIGNSEAQVTYAGAAPYLVSGAMQVNARIPFGLQPGAYAVTLRLGRFSSQLGVTLVVK